MSETPTIRTSAPMSAYRLARVHEIRQMVEDTSECTPGNPSLARAFADLFAERSWLMLETVRFEARAAEAEAQVAMLRVELAEQEGRANPCQCDARSDNECTCR